MERLRIGIVLVFFAVLSAGAPARGDCPLDHHFLGQEDGKLAVDRQQIYRHGDPAECYYPLSWSPIYGCWSNGEPGFGEYSAGGSGGEMEGLAGEHNVDYQIWFEILDLSPDFKLRTDDGTWLTQIGDRYNLSQWNEHHVHMKYRAYVPENPPPDYAFYVTYQLVDDFGMYEDSEPFICVSNAPAAAVEETTPLYRGSLGGLEDAQLTFTFHRAVTVMGGPPLTITDEDTHSQDYYTGYFGYEVSPDGMTLILNQTGGTLPNETWLEASLTQNVKDANATNQRAIPYTQFVYTRPAGDMNCDGALNMDDVEAFVLALIDPPAYDSTYDCEIALADMNHDGARDGRDIQPFVSALLQP
ncbi:MAG: hypothetical protein JXQ75_02325 [Phycisphaerae bacterium]|nr:hypothetical protein [Phycisphaerae bacterium]